MVVIDPAKLGHRVTGVKPGPGRLVVSDRVNLAGKRPDRFGRPCIGPHQHIGGRLKVVIDAKDRVPEAGQANDIDSFHLAYRFLDTRAYDVHELNWIEFRFAV
jgi:hypothetical protein